MNLFETQWNINCATFCEFTDGQEVETVTGTYYLLEKKTELLPSQPDNTVEYRIDLRETVFLDIESTGLRPSRPLFLVGLLHCRGGQLVLRQYLARHPREEGPLLTALARELTNYQVLITYNGKSFDMPYIENRMSHYGLNSKWQPLHIDLLWHARNHYRGVLPNCRLVTLEENILRQRRHDDVPGSLIPQVYRTFVQKQEPALMRGILEHNALDLISLYKLLPILHRD